MSEKQLFWGAETSLFLIDISVAEGVLIDSPSKLKKQEEEEITINSLKIPINLSNSD